MKLLAQILCCVALLASICGATTYESDLDSNVAYYEGEDLNYVVYAPYGYKMVIDEATTDGYSFAFVPQEDEYSDAGVLIGVNIYKIRGLSFDEAIAQDTTNVRKHYGENLTLRPVDSVYAGSGKEILTFYLGDDSSIIPTVMMAYYDGGTELLIFELNVALGTARYRAEEIFLACLERFKAMPIGDLGQK